MGERQTRRHLTATEAELALGRGEDVEILLGRCGDTERPGIRFAALSRAENSVRLAVFEMADARNPEFLDLYETRPLDESGDGDGRVVEKAMGSVPECLAFLLSRFPDQNLRMVNFGVLGDEYRDYLAEEFGQSDG